jgi:hypothetical protein
MKPEKPQSEPEILPPDHDDRAAMGRAQRVRVFVDAQGNQRVFVRPIGPFGFFGLALILAVVSAALLLLFFGAFLFLLPVLFLVLAGAIFAALLRGYFRAFR